MQRIDSYRPSRSPSLKRISRKFGVAKNGALKALTRPRMLSSMWVSFFVGLLSLPIVNSLAPPIWERYVTAPKQLAVRAGRIDAEMRGRLSLSTKEGINVGGLPTWRIDLANLPQAVLNVQRSGYRVYPEFADRDTASLAEELQTLLPEGSDDRYCVQRAHFALEQLGKRWGHRLLTPGTIEEFASDVSYIHSYRWSHYARESMEARAYNPRSSWKPCPYVIK